MELMPIPKKIPTFLKRQPTGSFMPVSASGEAAKVTENLKLAGSRADVILSKIAALEKEALKVPGGKTIATFGLLGALHTPQEAKGQFSWVAKKVLSPLVESLSGSNPKMPGYDTTRAALSPVHWIEKQHPLFAHYSNEFKSGMNDSTLSFNRFSVDTAKEGKNQIITAHGYDAEGNATHRLHRIEPMTGPGGNSKLITGQQWVDKTNANDAKLYTEQRNRAYIGRKNKGNLASR